MFSWKKNKEKKRTRPNESEENEFGIKLDRGQNDKELEAELRELVGVDNLPEDDNVNEDEEDVETELLKLIGKEKGKKQPKKAPSSDEPLGDISALTADFDLGDEDVEVDENDEELLQELLELVNPDDAVTEEQEVESDSATEDHSSGGDSDILKTLKERLKMYKTAEEKAKENNESTRARRFSRGIKTLEDLLKKTKQGKAVSPSDIPPVIALNLKPAPPPSATPENADEVPEESEDLSQKYNPPADVSNSDAPPETEDIMTTLRERLQLYHTAETKAKESGETTRARRFARGIKTLESLIKQAQAGKPIASDDIPPVVPLNLKPAPPIPVQRPSDDNDEEVENETGNVTLTDAPEEFEPQESQKEERSIEEILSERLKMYKTAEAKAKESGESSRARRFGRGIKTLQDLIKQAGAGKPVNPDDIPPEIALNLKPAPPVVVQEEENPQEPSIERENLVRSSDIPAPLSFAAVEDVDVDAELEDEETPTTVLEGLEQRVRFYTKFQEKAKQDGDSALADQNGRIVRVYMNAISTFKKGGYVDVLKLPNPKGCPPIPIPFYVP